MKRRDRSKQDTEPDGTTRTIKEKFEGERSFAPLKPLTETQADYLDALKTSMQVIVVGPAGTGKTHLAGTHAADQYRLNRINKIVITRPNAPSGRSIGCFPGTLKEKMEPWVVPFMDVLRKRGPRR